MRVFKLAYVANPIGVSSQETVAFFDFFQLSDIDRTEFWLFS